VIGGRRLKKRVEVVVWACIMSVKEIKLLEERENRLVGRKEAVFLVDHFGEGTPRRLAVRERVAEALGVPVNFVVVRRIVTEYGATRSKALVHIYDSEARLREVEPEHVIRKNFGGGESGE